MLEPILPVAHGKKGPPLISRWQEVGWGELNNARKNANGSNLGLRLDNYLAIDPDDEAAIKICDELELDGTLPPTVCWKTWRNRTVRIYQLPQKKHLSAPIKPTGSPMLELRMGAGQYVLIPPSVVNDKEINHTGFYKYLPQRSPSEIEPAELPFESLEKLIEIAKSGGGCVHGVVGPSQKKTYQPATVNFEKGSRDNSLYSVALALRKGGMGRSDVEQTLRHLAAACQPPVSEREVSAKVESAFKATPGERNFQVEIENWIELNDGVFSTIDLDRDLALNSKNEKTARRMVLKRLREKEYIKRVSDKSQLYVKVNSGLQKIDYKSADPNNALDIRWPFRIHKYVNIFPQNIVIIGGASNAGKTAFMLNVAAANSDKHRIRYLSSEMGPEELRLRLELFELPLNFWDKIDFYDRSFDFAAVTSPTGITIIDYLEISDNFFQIGAEIKAIYDKLTTGVAIIAIQKKQGTDFARGGEFTLEKARLYLSIDPGRLKIVKGKNWAQAGLNPNGMEFPFKLVQGCKFIDK